MSKSLCDLMYVIKYHCLPRKMLIVRGNLFLHLGNHLRSTLKEVKIK